MSKVPKCDSNKVKAAIQSIPCKNAPGNMLNTTNIKHQKYAIQMPKSILQNIDSVKPVK